MEQEPGRCNLCGKKLDLFDIQEDFSIRKPCIGYGSKYDGECVEFRLCCSCFDDIADLCTITPIRLNS